MLPIRRRIVLASAAALVAFLGPLSLTSSRLVATELIPSQLSDEAFWNMVTEFSEPNGYFRADNFVSNETTFQYVIRELKKVTPGGVYLGVGPDQNFTYVVAMRPKLAVIFDIRRQNMLQHLMYKALIEMSDDRTDFISRLFSRRRPATSEANASAAELSLTFENVPIDRVFFLENLQPDKKQLQQRHGCKR